MKKIIYTCDCCGAEAQDPMQLVPTMIEGGVVNKYTHMTERHFCQNCTDLLIRYSYGPVTVRDIIERTNVLVGQKEKSDEENQKIIETLNAELEQLRGVDPEEVRLLKNKNEEMEAKIVRQKNLIDQLRADIERLEATGKAKPDEPPITILTPEEVEAEKDPPVKASVRKRVGGRQAKYDKNQIMRMHRDGMTNAAIAERLGCDPSYISQVLTKMKEAEKNLPEAAE